ncbi:unnamed protein product [Musa acuminata subsp. malaccensis]|uniref:(wild Malaysian banana) hypothetical protein n=1 Tax=Musa acuminata subsp. malaccensis TaxID=214687 RepID=A0A8D6ZY73_MUSAM|nr:unnamed protein product [Musa acuminata subsp. malaccensis]
MAGAKKNNVVRKYNTRQCSRGKRPSPSSSSGPSCYRGKKPSPSSSSGPSCYRGKKPSPSSSSSGPSCYRGKKPSPSSFSGPSCPPPPAQPSFFKIMLGGFKEHLFIPPKFAKRLVGLVNQNVCLQDCLGNSSSVKISVVDSSLAFQEGWHDFVLDHSIDFGEFLVFKYLSKSLFSVQVFGIDACEREEFGERNGNSSCTRKTSNADLSLGRLQFRKRRRTFEVSKDESCPGKKHLGTKDDSSDSDVQILEDECVAKDAVEFGNEPKETPQHHHDPGSSQIADVIDLTGPQVNMFSGQVIVEPEENVPVERSKTCVAKGVVEFGTESKETLQHHRDPGSLQIADVKDLTGPLVNMFSGQVSVEPKRNVPVERSKTYVAHGILLDDQKTVETGIHFDHMVTFQLVEQSLSGHEDSHGKSHTAPTVACRRSKTKDQIVSCWGTIPYNSKLDSSLPQNETKNYLAEEPEEHKIKKIGLKGHSTPEVMTAILVASEMVACKFLLTEEGICHIVNDYEKNGLGAVTVTPICVSTMEIGTCIDCNHSVTMSNDASCHLQSVPEVNFHGPATYSIETSNGMRTYEENGNAPGFLSGKDFSKLDGSVRSILQDVPGIDTPQGNSIRYGMMLDALPVEDEDAVCMRSQNLEPVEVDNMDLDDLSLANSFCFRLTLSSSNRCQLLNHSINNGIIEHALPLGIPFHMRQERKDIILRDPSGRSWPVLYHESNQFIGFLNGWEEFATANNLQQGNLCEFFVVTGAPDPTFQVQIRHT